MGLNISPSILQSYINAILECLQSRKYCEAMMDDLLLFTSSKKSHKAKLEDLLNVKCSEQNYNTWVMQYLYKIEEFVLSH